VGRLVAKISFKVSSAKQDDEVASALATLATELRIATAARNTWQEVVAIVEAACVCSNMAN